MTAGSFAISATGRPATVPIPVTTPSAPRPSCSQLASRPSSASESASSSRATRSRTGSFSCSATFLRWRSGPPSSAASRAALISVIRCLETQGGLRLLRPRSCFSSRIAPASSSLSSRSSSSSSGSAARPPARGRAGRTHRAASKGSAPIGRAVLGDGRRQLGRSAPRCRRGRRRAGAPGRRSRPRCPRGAGCPRRRSAGPSPRPRSTASAASCSASSATRSPPARRRCRVSSA